MNDIPKITHPLEGLLDLEPGSTNIATIEHETESMSIEVYDDKDSEIDGQFQEIYNAAMGAFEAQSQEAELVEGKYKALIGDVAVQYLNTALTAAREKSNLKQHKDKLLVAQNKLKGGDSKTYNNTLIVADRNEILQHISNGLLLEGD